MRIKFHSQGERHKVRIPYAGLTGFLRDLFKQSLIYIIIGQGAHVCHLVGGLA